MCPWNRFASVTAEADYDGYDLSGFASGSWAMIRKGRHRLALDGALSKLENHSADALQIVEFQPA